MDQSLRVLFERALDDEPPPPPGDLAREAIAGGLRRRRRRLLAGAAAGLVMVLSAAVAVNLVAAPGPAPPTAMTLASKAECRGARYVQGMISIYLRSDVTDEQRADLDSWLRSDPRVWQSRYQPRDEAWERFKEYYRDAPDLVNAVDPAQLPDSFHVTLRRATQSDEVMRDARRRPGVETVIPTQCEDEEGTAGE